MSDTNPIREFFDRCAANWDDNANDPLDWIADVLVRAGVRKGQKALDLACGTGAITGVIRWLTEEAVLGLDISGEMIARAKEKYKGVEGVSFQQADFLEYEGGVFDAIVLYNAYPHFLNPEELSKTFARHLAENGFFVIFHSFGRERLRRHHEGLASAISRDIGSPEEEGKSFQNEFDLYIQEEDANHYLLCGRRKNN